VYPDGAKVQNKDVRLPLHGACKNMSQRYCFRDVGSIPHRYQSSREGWRYATRCVFKERFIALKLLDLYPESAKVQMKDGSLSLH
jgi:hypothetical protein